MLSEEMVSRVLLAIQAAVDRRENDLAYAIYECMRPLIIDLIWKKDISCSIASEFFDDEEWTSVTMLDKEGHHIFYERRRNQWPVSEAQAA